MPHNPGRDVELLFFGSLELFSPLPFSPRGVGRVTPPGRLFFLSWLSPPFVGSVRPSLVAVYPPITLGTCFRLLFPEQPVHRILFSFYDRADLSAEPSFMSRTALARCDLETVDQVFLRVWLPCVPTKNFWTPHFRQPPTRFSPPRTGDSAASAGPKRHNDPQGSGCPYTKAPLGVIFSGTFGLTRVGDRRKAFLSQLFFSRGSFWWFLGGGVSGPAEGDHLWRRARCFFFFSAKSFHFPPALVRRVV